MSQTAAAPSHIHKSKYIPYLDGLRGLAILGVLADHFHVPLPPLFHVGPVGVRFFFILSGYFITLSLWKVREAETKSPLERFFLLCRFYLQRLMRVGPPFYLALALGALFGIHEVWDHFLWLALFQTNHYILYLGYWPLAISHYWSLAVQEQFYVVWPLFVLTLPRRGFLPCMVACMVFALAFRVYCITTGVNDLTRWVTLLGCLDSFAAGAHGAARLRAERDRLLLPRPADDHAACRQRMAGVRRIVRRVLPVLAADHVPDRPRGEGQVRAPAGLVAIGLSRPHQLRDLRLSRFHHHSPFADPYRQRAGYFQPQRGAAGRDPRLLGAVMALFRAAHHRLEERAGQPSAEARACANDRSGGSAGKIRAGVRLR
jgi:hypothetical protein